MVEFALLSNERATHSVSSDNEKFTFVRDIWDDTTTDLLTKAETRMKIAPLAVAMGALALMLALGHFWGGPFATQPSHSTTVAEKAVEIREAAQRAFRGEPQPPPERPSWTLDRGVQVGTAALAGLAVVLAALAYGRKENPRMALAGAALGVGAITFQFVTWLALALLMTLLVAAVLQNFRELVGLE